jgi:hypothetical protein
LVSRQNSGVGATKTPRPAVSLSPVANPYARDPTTTDSTVCSVTSQVSLTTVEPDAAGWPMPPISGGPAPLRQLQLTLVSGTL